jgi:hypothetical protein
MGSKFDCMNGPGFVGFTVSVSKLLLECVSVQLGLSLPGKFLRGIVLAVRHQLRALHRLSDNTLALLTIISRTEA